MEKKAFPLIPTLALLKLLSIASFYTFASTDTDKILPFQRAEFSLTTYEHRDIHFFKAAKSQDSSKPLNSQIYFIEPLMMFYKPVHHDYPWEIVADGDDKFLKFEILFHDTDQTQRANNKAREYFRIQNLDSQNLDIRLWPTKSIYLYFYDKWDENKKPILSLKSLDIGSKEKRTKAIISKKIDINFDITSLQDLFKNERLMVRIEYLYDGAKESQASQSAEFISKQMETIDEKISTAINNANPGGGQFIFANTEKEIKKIVRREIRASIAATNPEILKRLPDIGKSFLNDVPRKSLSIEAQDLQSPASKALAKYFEPLVNTKIIKKEDENKQKILIDIGNKAQKAKFEKEHKTKLIETDKSNTYAPISINYIDAKGLDSSIIENYFIDIAVSQGIIDAPQYLDSFNISNALYNTIPTRSEIAKPYNIPVGSVLCSLSKEKNPPEGFVWLDGKNIWPHLSWIPAKAGENLPNLNGFVLRGTELQSVGITHKPRINISESRPDLTHDDRLIYGLQLKESAEKKVGDIRVGRAIIERGKSLSANTATAIAPYSITYRENRKTYSPDRIKSLPAYKHKLSTNTIGHDYIGCRWMIRMDLTNE